MLMGIGTNTAKPDAGALGGTQTPIACDAWFTSTGRIIPRSFQLKDEDGTLHTYRGIQVLTTEETRYCGIPAVHFECQMEHCGVMLHFGLVYYMQRKEWKLLAAGGRSDSRQGRQ